MYSLTKALKDAQERGTAIGHFNVSELVSLKAVFSSAQNLGVPVLVGVSEGERDFIGVRQIAALVRSLREEFDSPVFLNADHTHSLARAIEAARAGFDAIAFDRSRLAFDQNVRETRQAVEAIKSVNAGIVVEGEIGDVGTGSEIHAEELHVSGRLTSPMEARQFVDATGVDVLAPSVGNMHGLSKSMAEGVRKKRLDIPRIAQIRSAADVPLTLHGGSGTDDDDLRSAIDAGINIVHINTELRIAWRRGLVEGLSAQPQQVVPYRILPFAVDSVELVVRSRLQLFNSQSIGPAKRA